MRELAQNTEREIGNTTSGSSNTITSTTTVCAFPVWSQEVQANGIALITTLFVHHALTFKSLHNSVSVSHVPYQRDSTSY